MEGGKANRSCSLFLYRTSRPAAGQESWFSGSFTKLGAVACTAQECGCNQKFRSARDIKRRIHKLRVTGNKVGRSLPDSGSSHVCFSEELSRESSVVTGSAFVSSGGLITGRYAYWLWVLMRAGISG